MYDCLLGLYISGVYKSSWICTIKMYLILVVCQGYGYIRSFQVRNGLNVQLVHIAVAMCNLFILQWRLEIEILSACDLYMEFKQKFKLEKYLMCTNGKYRQAICNIRTQYTRSPKVIGRYKHIDRNLRVCNVCAESKIGDEYHWWCIIWMQSSRYIVMLIWFIA